MKLGISIDVATRSEMEDYMKAASEAGFKYCQLFYRGDDISEEWTEEVKDKLKKYGLQLGPVGGYINALKPGQVTMGYTLEKLLKLVKLMPKLGSREVIIWSGTLSDGHMFQYDEKNGTDEAFTMLRETCGKIIEELKNFDGLLSVEPFFTHIIKDEETYLRLKNYLLSPNLRIIMDTPNFMTREKFDEQDKTIDSLFDALQQDISTVHFKDIKRREDDWPFDYPGPGDGELNYRKVFENLEKYNFNGYAIIEHVEPAQFGAAKQFIEKFAG